ncbi:hypothetical protein TTHERM_00239010 (macronuclear) [Tetrahymena thermophila SB210]|uniref:Uncharacterized protein n=1 Tax=Tetrahymena thermophila (strain SB210) TaxID=312017 RepID=I7LXG2_TETTS|nr:hypothetical protein TTHERM_00239010 [Tetrahymena thermophila SB210]EAS04581.1 hypothetical protein TTHERM_00239010 [Tetrahymena thermophila SB210]|eukprot:XP_001024826.1 hypothetical protein TTHERM_00239010 [Tetrahymena thermophila SB210]
MGQKMCLDGHKSEIYKQHTSNRGLQKKPEIYQPESESQKIYKQHTSNRGLQKKPEISQSESESQKYVEKNYSGDITILLYDITNINKKPLKIKYFRNNFDKGLLLRQVHIIYPSSYVYYFDEKNNFKCLNSEDKSAKIYDILCNPDFKQLGANKHPWLYISLTPIQNQINQEDEILKTIQECRNYVKSL